MATIQVKCEPMIEFVLPDWFIGDEVALVENYINGHLKLAIRRVNGGPRHYGVIMESNRDDLHVNKSFVLPCHVEVAQETVIPSAVRFQVFDDDSRALREPVFAFRHVQWINKILEGRINGKVAVSTRFFAVATRERQCRIDPEFEEFLSHLWVKLFDQGVRWAVDPGFEALSKAFEMGYGPIGSRIGTHDLLYHHVS